MKLGCHHCEGSGPEPGWIEMDNNGPIVACPLCNLKGEEERAWDLAMAQKLRQDALKAREGERS